jgi:hypothetical protein
LKNETGHLEEHDNAINFPPNTGMLYKYTIHDEIFIQIRIKYKEENQTSET